MPLNVLLYNQGKRKQPEINKEEKNMMNIKELAKKFKNAVAVEDLAYQAAFEEFDINSDVADKLADEWEACNDYTNYLRGELAREITNFTNKQVDCKTAWAMTFKPELFNLIDRLA